MNSDDKNEALEKCLAVAEAKASDNWNRCLKLCEALETLKKETKET